MRMFLNTILNLIEECKQSAQDDYTKTKLNELKRTIFECRMNYCNDKNFKSKDPEFLSIIKAFASDECEWCYSYDPTCEEDEAFLNMHTKPANEIYNLVVKLEKEQERPQVETLKKQLEEEVNMYCDNCYGKMRCIEEIRGCENMAEVEYKDYVMRCRTRCK